MFESWAVAAMACYRHDGTIDEDAYDAIRGAVAEMSDTFGHIDCVESFNEWWLPLDARLRADFGAEGLTSGELAYLNRKSLMKKCFIAAGIDVMPGKLVENLKDSEAFLKASSNDIIVKPDWGVGASDTRRIRSVAELKEFFASRRHGVEYFMAAALAAAENGVKDILLIERDQYLGGILNQCIHPGFGLHQFKEELTGPEYAARFMEKVKARREIEVSLRSFVVRLTRDRVLTYLKPGALEEVRAKAVIMGIGALLMGPIGLLVGAAAVGFAAVCVYGAGWDSGSSAPVSDGYDGHYGHHNGNYPYGYDGHGRPCFRRADRPAQDC